MNPKSKGTILVVGSNARTLRLQGGATFPTGNYLNETVVPIQALNSAGYDAVVATPSGARPALDMRSVAASHFGGDQVAMEKALAFFERDDSLQNVRSLRQVVAEGLDRFSGFFVPGGHAPIEDLAADPDLGEILRHAHAQGKPTAFLCHGPIAVLSAMPNSKAFERAMVDGDAAAASAAATGWQYSGYRMTIFSKSEERPVEANVLGGRLLYPVADALTAAGGLVENGPDYGSYVVTDRELITGQNPRSDRALAESLIAALDARPRG